jgi:hypothetical protein
VKSTRLIHLVTLLLAGSLAAPAYSQDSDDGPRVRFTSFDVPGAEHTEPADINDKGTITGSYDDEFGTHGFVRTANGTFTSFDVPSTLDAEATLPSGIGGNGEVAGYYLDTLGLQHGFSRTAKGVITNIDAPGAIETVAWAVNSSHVIIGYFFDAAATAHGFRLAPDGTVTVIDAPGAATGLELGTYAHSITDAGDIAGEFSDSTGTFHGFLLTDEGAFTIIDAPNASTGFELGTFSGTEQALNSHGQMTGQFTDVNGTLHGFVRARDGKIRSFDAPSAGTYPYGTYAVGINATGAVTGNDLDNNNLSHGFIRRANGQMVPVEAGAGTTGTFPKCINASGEIAGDYYDANGIEHGFIARLRTDD